MDGRSARQGFRRGVIDILPAIPPNIPFGMLFGAAAVDVGISPVEATAMSLIVFAGAAQLAAVDLLQTDTALPIIVVTVLVINSRYVIYSASIAPLVQHLPRRWRAAMGIGLFDVNFAFFMDRFTPTETDIDEANETEAAETDSDETEAAETDSDETDEPAIHRGGYYMGLTVPAIASFVLATAVGALLGSAVGEQLNLSFAIPLIFIAIVTPLIDSNPAVATALVAAVVSVGAAGLPFNIGLLVAICCAVGVGTVVENSDRLRSGVTR